MPKPKQPEPKGNHVYSKESGLWIHNDKKGDRQIGGPLTVHAIGRNEDRSGWCYVVEFQDCDGLQQHINIPFGWLNGQGSKFIEALEDRGYLLHLETGDRRLLFRYIRQFAQGDTSPRVRLVDQNGWVGNNFICGRSVFGPSAKEVVRSEQIGQSLDKFGTAGTVREWREELAAVVAGNSRLMLAICASLLPPLMEPLGIDNFGLNFAGKSGKGKTTCLIVAGSIWGGGRADYCETWAATTNGLEVVAAEHNGVLLAIDEVQGAGRLPGTVVLDAAFRLGLGKSKLRANSTGSRRAAEAAVWHLVYLSSGERTLAQLAEEAGDTLLVGHSVRLIDVPIDAGEGMGAFETLPDGCSSPKRFSKDLKKRARAFYGTAAQVYLRRLTAHMDEDPISLKAWLARKIDKFDEAAKDITDAGPVGRIVNNFGAIYAAGCLARRFRILPWDWSDILDACLKCCADATEAMRLSFKEADANAISDFKKVAEKNRARIFDLDEDTPTKKQLDEAFGVLKTTPKGRRELWVLPDRFRAITAEERQDGLLDALRRRKILITHKDGASTVPRQFRGARTRVHAFRARRIDKTL